MPAPSTPWFLTSTTSNPGFPVAGPAALCTAAMLGAAAANARITHIQVTTHESPTFGVYSWPGVGQYKKIAGKA